MTDENQTIYEANFTLTKTFNVKVAFHAPDLDTAKRMAKAMEYDTEILHYLEEECDDDGDLEEVSYWDDAHESRYRMNVDYDVREWCRDWLKQQVEETAEDAE